MPADMHNIIYSLAIGSVGCFASYFADSLLLFACFGEKNF